MKTMCVGFRAGAVLRLVGLLGLISGAAAVTSRLRASAKPAARQQAMLAVSSGADGNASHKAVQLQTQKSVLGGSQTTSATSQEAFFRQLAGEALEGKRRVMQLVEAAEPKFTLNDALQRVEGSLPVAVATLVHSGLEKSKAASTATAKAGCKQGDDFSEDSLQNARRILNGMVETAVKDLDDTTIKCQEFTARNRETFSQVTADLAIYGSDLSKMGEEKVQHIEGTAAMDREFGSLMFQIQTHVSAFDKEKFEDQQLLTERANDLAVFDFILQLTQCGGGPTNCSASLLQTAAERQRCTRPVSLCSTHGEMRLRFNDTKLQRKMEALMTPGARKALREALGQVGSGKATDLLQRNGFAVRGVAGAMQNVTNDSVVTTSMMPGTPVEAVPVTEGPDPAGQWKKCVDAPYDCGFVHDMMSLEWGKFRDLVDELKDEMGKKQKEFEEMQKNLKEQLAEVVHQKTVHSQGIAAIISETNLIQQQVAEKNTESKDLTHEYDEETAECTKTISHILFNEICAVRMIRNALMGCSSTSPPSNISDCDVTDWVGDRCEDTHGNELMCDDECPKANPFECGGMQTITREIVVAPNEFGLKCPSLSRQRKCNQFKCPVDCSLSDWSGWSACSKECGDGVKSETRDVLIKPVNGGEACDALDDTRACNSFSCDRDCALEAWTEWSSCSMSCSMDGFKGSQTRVRKVSVEIRANGKCADELDSTRYEVQACNTHVCSGDEICIASMDLILAIDGSGSLKEEGFTTLKQFAANITSRYRGEYFGKSDVKLGIVLFGQGHVETLADGSTTITPAENALPLTADIDSVEASLKGLRYQGGFTNLAQALNLADVMLQQGGRPEAQSAVMVISDGKYSMEFQTAQEVKKLKDKNTMLFMLPITEFDSDEVKTMKTWASEPTDTNFERIPGLESLEFNLELFSQRVVAKFCPDSMSPSQMIQVEQTQEFMKVHEQGWPSNACGPWVLIGQVPSIDECAREARERGKSAFSFGYSYAENTCYGESMEVTMENWHFWAIHRSAPPCPNGAWLFNPYFDSYVIMPME